MDTLIAFPTAIARPGPATGTGPAARHASRTPRWALAAALAATILTAAAGGILDSSGAAGQGACVPRPVPGGAWPAADCVAHPIPGR